MVDLMNPDPNVPMNNYFIEGYFENKNKIIVKEIELKRKEKKANNAIIDIEAGMNQCCITCQEIILKAGQRLR